MPVTQDPAAEWLETDGLGGFASGTVNGIRTRRYHGLLVAAATPPTGRMVLVQGFDAWVETDAGRFALTSQAYSPDVTSPDGATRITGFEPEPWPRWRFTLDDGTRVVQELFMRHGAPLVAVSWRLVEPHPGVRLILRPFFSGRDYHSLHHENNAFQFAPASSGETLTWTPYQGVPGIAVTSNGRYQHEPRWYRNFIYAEERARGLDFTEDAASPGVFIFDLSGRDAVWMAGADLPDAAKLAGPSAASWFESMRAAETRRRAGFASRLHRSADAYLVRRGAGKTIVAGYPWFTDWGRDTFIAMRGLCLSTGRFEDALEILLEWSGQVSQGMLPNRFPDQGGAPEFNAVDASLWYVVGVHEFLETAAARGVKVTETDALALRTAVESILEGHVAGTRFGIRMDEDGLLAAGEPGVQLTWMDSKIGDWVVTARTGKPVEIQALWLNALRIASAWEPQWKSAWERGLAAFRTKFWNESTASLYDVVDVDHVAGKVDATFRPNQILAAGGLPFPLLSGEQAWCVVEAVELSLLTPMGLRSLAPTEPGYQPRYRGGSRERDAAYHQGTVWPWLIGPFVEAWVRVRKQTPAAREEARQRFLQPLLRHLDEAGLGHISEIADGGAPHTPRGCPFQAWSVGECLRLIHGVLAEPKAIA